jgi:hypothetical protein
MFVCMQVYFYGDAEEAFKKKETVLYLGNHQSTGISFAHHLLFTITKSTFESALLRECGV